MKSTASPWNPAATRRRALGLAAGSAIVAATGPAAAIEADPLEALWHQYEQAFQRVTAAAEAESAAIEAAKRNYPPRPSLLYGRNVDTGQLTPLERGTLLQWRDTAMNLRIGGAGRIDRALATMDEWERACDAVDRSHGIDEHAAHADALCSAMEAIEVQIVETAPRSMRGVVIKLRLAARWDSLRDGDTYDETGIGRIVLGLIADLESGQ